MDFIYLLFIIPLFFLLRKLCYVKDFLLDDKSLPHKSKFSNKSVPLLGGVLILISFLFIFEINNYYLLILFSGLFLCHNQVINSDTAKPKKIKITKALLFNFE